MIRIGVCDDDMFFAKQLGSMLSECFDKKAVGTDISVYNSGEALISHHKTRAFDVVFLDIDMPRPDGFETAKLITRLAPNCFIIFVTSHNELVYDSFMFRPLNFVMKGSRKYMSDRLVQVTDQLILQIRQNESIILENSDIGRKAVLLRDIVYIESCDHDISYHTVGADEPVVVRSPLSDAEAKLGEYDFVRIHKAFIVNLRHVFNIDLSNRKVRLRQGTELPLGRKYKDYVDKSLTEYLRRTR